MDLIIMFFAAAMICVTVGGIGLYIQTKKRLDDIEDGLKLYDQELTTHKRDIRILKERDARKSDRIYIYSDPAADIVYPHEGGL